MSGSGPMHSLSRANGPTVWYWTLLLVLALGMVACGGKDETAQSPQAAGQKSPPPVAGDAEESEEVLSLDQPLAAAAERRDDIAGVGSGDVDQPAKRTTAATISGSQAPAPELQKEASPAREAAGTGIAAGATSSGSGPYCLQVGSFRKREHAQERVRQLAAAGQSADIVTAEVQGQTHYRVWIRNLPSRRDAESLGERLQGELGFPFLVRQE